MSRRPFSYFVIFAEMRTGSNFLEQNINQFSDLHCYGEMFNPQFIGDAQSTNQMGVSLKDREKDPAALISKLRDKDATIIPGFRFFYDHDPRILKSCLADKSCGKVILTRNSLDSYVSRKIATKTGQWKLTDLKDQRSARITFSSSEFEKHLQSAQDFQLHLLQALQTTGQTAFYINYDDINTLNVLNGLATFLGAGTTVKSLDTNLKKQNPTSLQSKVVNYDAMTTALSKIDFFNLSGTPNFEPRRGPGVPSYFAGNTVPLLFAPIKGAPHQIVTDWMEKHDQGAPDGLMQGFNQKTLRQWRRRHPHFQSLTVVRHPLARAYSSFCKYILPNDIGAYREIRTVLTQSYGLQLPGGGAGDAGYDLQKHRSAFLDFLTFLKGNLSGQSHIRVDAAWASQTAVLQGICDLAPVGHIIREDQIGLSLRHLETLLDLDHHAISESGDSAPPFALSAIYDADIEEKSRAVYQRDYLHFGFTDWSPPA